MASEDPVLYESSGKWHLNFGPRKRSPGDVLEDTISMHRTSLRRLKRYFVDLADAERERYVDLWRAPSLCGND
jgi:hypothetical protein